MSDAVIDARPLRAISFMSGECCERDDPKPGAMRKADGGEFTGSGTAFVTAPGEHPSAPETGKHPAPPEKGHEVKHLGYGSKEATTEGSQDSCPSCTTLPEMRGRVRRSQRCEAA